MGRSSPTRRRGRMTTSEFASFREFTQLGPRLELARRFRLSSVACPSPNIDSRIKAANHASFRHDRHMFGQMSSTHFTSPAPDRTAQLECFDEIRSYQFWP